MNVEGEDHVEYEYCKHQHMQPCFWPDKWINDQELSAKSIEEEPDLRLQVREEGNWNQYREYHDLPPIVRGEQSLRDEL